MQNSIDQPEKRLKTSEMSKQKHVIQTTEEEKLMNGAPEGELLDVTVLSREEIQASSNPQESYERLNDMVKQIGNQSNISIERILNWGDHYEGVVIIRRLALFHPEYLSSEILNSILSIVLSAVSSLRSVVSRNAVLCLSDLFFSLKLKLIPCLSRILPVLLFRLGNEKKFIREIAKKTMEEAIKYCSCNQMLMELLIGGRKLKNFHAIECCSLFIETCLKQLRIGEKISIDRKAEEKASCGLLSDEIDWKELFESFHVLLNSKSAVGRKSISLSLGRLRIELSETQYQQLLHTYVKGETIQKDLTASTNIYIEKSDKGGRSILKKKSGGLSLRERMLQRKQQLQASTSTTA